MSTNRKTLACKRCGRPVTVGVEATSSQCWACTGFEGDPPDNGERYPDIPHRRDLAECCNWASGTCIVRERAPCIVLDGKRCGWWERAVLPAGRLSGRVCAGCGGDVPRGRRYCDRCRKARRRTAYRESERRKRVSCQQLAAPTPLYRQESEAVRAENGDA